MLYNEKSILNSNLHSNNKRVVYHTTSVYPVLLNIPGMSIRNKLSKVAVPARQSQLTELNLIRK